MTEPGAKVDIKLSGTNATSGLRLTASGSANLAGYWTENQLAIKNTTDDTFAVVLGSDGTSSYIKNGNVGIGTTAPGAKFSVHLNEANTTTVPYINMYNNASGYADWSLKKTGANDLTMYNMYDDVPVMTWQYVAGSGNVGIGTTSPGTKLDVNGEIRIANANWYYGLNGGGTSQPLIRSRGMGYSPGSYPGLQIGQAGDHIALGIDPGSIAGGAFGGSMVEVAMPNDIRFIQGNSDSTNWLVDVIRIINGNVGIGNSNPTHKIMLSGGAYSDGVNWTDVSDRNLKTNFQTLNPQTILEKIQNLPITQWNYKSESSEIKHIGTMAQDFYAQFSLGGSLNGMTSISAMDTGGVALLGIQALNSKINEFIAQSNSQLSSLTSQFSLLQNNYSALDLLSQSTVKKTTALEKNINTLGAGTNFLRDRMEKIAMQNFVTADNRVAQTVSFENFSTENQTEISSNLSETKLADQTFIGKYQAVGNYGEVKVNLGEKKDFSASDTGAGYLTFEIYLDNAEGLSDFNTELGNVMDQKELQWNRANHPYFTTGWNIVRLALNEGIKTGEVDWSALNYFRVYFNFTQTQEIKIRNINLELKSKYVPLAQTVDAKDLDLFSNTDQGTALKNIFGELKSQAEANQEKAVQLTELSQDLQTMREQMALLQEQTKAVIDLTLAMSLDKVLYRDSEGSVLGINVMAAEKVEAKKVEAEDYVVSENVDPVKNNVGSVIIRIGQQEVLVANEKVLYNSKIIVTPVGSSPVAWVISEKIDNQGFKIKLDKPAEFDIAFDFWVIGVER